MLVERHGGGGQPLLMSPQRVGPFLLKLCGRGSVGGVLFQGIVVDDKVQTIAVQVGQALAYGGVVPSKLDHGVFGFLCVASEVKSSFSRISPE